MLYMLCYGYCCMCCMFVFVHFVFQSSPRVCCWPTWGTMPPSPCGEPLSFVAAHCNFCTSAHVQLFATVHMYTLEKRQYTVETKGFTCTQWRKACTQCTVSGEQLLTATFGPHQITLRPYSAQLSAPGMISYILHCTFHSALFMAFGKMFKT